MRQDRFTEQAQEALALSQQLVHEYKHSQWDICLLYTSPSPRD